MKTEIIPYTAGDVECVGYLAYEETIDLPKPAVLVAHAWKGQDDFARGKAEALAELGYVGFAVDLYGSKINAANNDEALALMKPLFLDRALLQQRMLAAYAAVLDHPEVESREIGGIGYCFGGTAIMELFRSGSPLKGVVSFHGTLARALGDQRAKLTSIAPEIKGSLLALHGYDDPMVSAEDLVYFQREYTEANVEWQLDVYGHTMHAFTNPEADDPSLGLKFSPKANKRAWEAMCTFFEEVFVS